MQCEKINNYVLRLAFLVIVGTFSSRVLQADSKKDYKECQIAIYDSREEMLKFGKEFLYFLKKESGNRSSEELEREEKLFNTLIKNINHGDIKKFSEKFLKTIPEDFYRGKNPQDALVLDIEKIFTNYYNASMKSNTSFSGDLEIKLKEENEASVTYNKILTTIYRVVLEQSHYSDSSIFETSYIIRNALETLGKKTNFSPVLQYFLESIFRKKDLRSLVKKIVSMSLQEYKDNERIINHPSITKNLRCIKKFKQASDQIQEEDDEKLLEGEAPEPLPDQVLEVLFLEGIKKSSLTNPARKKLLRYLEKKDYKSKDPQWNENTPLIKKIIQALSGESKRSKYEESESRRSRSYDSDNYGRGASLISASRGSSDRSRVSFQGAGLLGYGVESVFRDSNSDEDKKKDEAPKLTINFWDRLRPKKRKTVKFLKKIKNLNH
ncbi:hypothetical protein HE1_00550 [Holospora elegans E1]|uniref:Uncharacterized protein n=1 Tax=Holospora elegans E1 TaxID=1427503 RepID=A0A023DY68_9PROT|nr:hypothetical protein [Holospora elegans]GAJ46224.1 hypothetical protein HE1_00550 [Holospora elegans E1]